MRSNNSLPSLFAVTEIELIYRNKVSPKDRLKITHSDIAYNILLNNWDFNKIELVEQAYALLLDRSNAVLGIYNLSTGGISSCLIDPKILFAAALKAKASGVILAHNHPSGNTQPSQADKQLTEKIVQGSKFLDISFLDHMIITPQTYFSFADEGLMFSYT